MHLYDVFNPPGRAERFYDNKDVDPIDTDPCSEFKVLSRSENSPTPNIKLKPFEEHL